MPVLRDARRERFAQILATGLQVEKAYAAAGFKGNAKNAWRCRNRLDVTERVNEILAAAASKNDVTVERVVGELAKIAFASAGDYFTWGPKGIKIIDSATLTEKQRSVVSEVQETLTEGGRSIRVKLSDKQAALEKLGRYLGMFREKVEIDANVRTQDVSPRERIARRIAGLAERGGSGGGS